jgi:hypothetical protein
LRRCPRAEQNADAAATGAISAGFGERKTWNLLITHQMHWHIEIGLKSARKTADRTGAELRPNMVMKINANISANGINPSVAVKRPAASKAGADDVSFQDSAVLETALEKLPETRAEAVERARNLIGDVHYPPEETIRKISHLLAIQLDSR